MKRTLLLTFLCLAAGCTEDNPGGPSGLDPTVSAISPAAGSSSGGTTVTITGTNFADGATVVIGGVPAEDVDVTGATSITAVTGPRTGGVVDVVVTLNNESATLGGGYTYVEPPAGANTAPIIQGIAARGTRQNEPPRFADLSEVINVTATIVDSETPASLLEYRWSAPAGTFSGDGRAVTWRAPAAFQTPGTVILSLEVRERYTAPGPGGLSIEHEHRVQNTITVRVHDSVKEVGEMARQFLLRYSDSSISPERVVEDFLEECNGREEEYEQVVDDREEARITSYEIGQPQVTVSFDGVCPFRAREADACSQMSVDWRDVELETGVPRHTWGVEHVTALYRNSRWGLCDADIDGQHERTGLTIRLQDR
ncbi:MAG: IPT/TIG domain-containing protein [Vicinamibacterales bacterium]